MVELIEELYLERVIDVKNKLFPILCTYKANMPLLGMTFAKLLQQKQVKSEVENILMFYLQSDNVWIWKSVLWGVIQSENEDEKIECRIQSLIGSKIKGGKYKDYKFILELVMFSERFRDLICIVFEKEFFKLKTKAQRDKLCNAYIYLLTNCYYRVNTNHKELAFVICDKKEQLLSLSHIYKCIMNNYHVRLQFFSLLKAYIKELAGYTYSDRLVKRLAGFIFFLKEDNKNLEKDILEVVNQCPREIVKKIHAFMS